MRDCKDCVFRRPDFDCRFKHDCWLKEKKFNFSKLHALRCDKYVKKENDNEENAKKTV